MSQCALCKGELVKSPGQTQFWCKLHRTEGRRQMRAYFKQHPGEREKMEAKAREAYSTVHRPLVFSEFSGTSQLHAEKA